MKIPQSILLLFISLTTMGQHLPFIRGADVSFGKEAVDSGFIFTTNGERQDYLQTLKENGFNWIRLRVFHSPDSLPNDLEYTLALAQEAKALNFKLLLDLHYSDTWADPGNQTPPKAWDSLGFDDLKDTVYNYTYSVLSSFEAKGLVPEMIQIGNELSNGFMWSWGSIPHNWSHFTQLLGAGISASKAACKNQTPAIMIHYDKSDRPDLAIDFYYKLEFYNIPFDYFGLSYYPWWHGPIKQFKKNLKILNKQLPKPIVIAETAFPWKPLGYSTKYPVVANPQNQKNFIKAIEHTCKKSKDGKCAGFFYWEPAHAKAPYSLWNDEGELLPALTK